MNKWTTDEMTPKEKKSSVVWCSEIAMRRQRWVWGWVWKNGELRRPPCHWKEFLYLYFGCKRERRETLLDSIFVGKA